MLIVIGKNKFQTLIKQLWEEAVAKVSDELAGIRSLRDLSAKVKQLREEAETLKIEAARKDEEYAKRDREIEHKVGLERERQKNELENAKREAVVTVREKNLEADRTRFEEQMKFHEDRFSKEVGYLKELLESVVKALPSAEFTADLTPQRKARR